MIHKQNSVRLIGIFFCNGFNDVSRCVCIQADKLRCFCVFYGMGKLQYQIGMVCAVFILLHFKRNVNNLFKRVLKGVDAVFSLMVVFRADCINDCPREGSFDVIVQMFGEHHGVLAFFGCIDSITLHPLQHGIDAFFPSNIFFEMSHIIADACNFPETPLRLNAAAKQPGIVVDACVEHTGRYASSGNVGNVVYAGNGYLGNFTV